MPPLRPPDTPVEVRVRMLALREYGPFGPCTCTRLPPDPGAVASRPSRPASGKAAVGRPRRPGAPGWPGRGRPGGWPGRTVTLALAGYLVAVAIGVGLVGRSAADAAIGVVFGVMFLLAAGVVVVTFWQFSQRIYAQQEQYRRELFDAEIGALARLREAG